MRRLHLESLVIGLSLLVLSQQPVHRRDRTQITVLVEQSGVDLAHRPIQKAFRVQMRQKFRFFRRGEGLGGGVCPQSQSQLIRPSLAIEGRSTPADRLAGAFDPGKESGRFDP